MSNVEETSWVEKIGKPAMDSLREMVAALECDYDRRSKLREELLAEYDAVQERNDPNNEAEFLAWVKASAEDNRHTMQEAAAELLELNEAAGECEDREDAEERIHEDALSVAVRSGWYTPGADDDSRAPEEFQILLATGGPAVRIMGELDGDGEPRRAWLEVQDWGKPWTEYYEPDAADLLLAYARCFCFSS